MKLIQPCESTVFELSLTLVWKTTRSPSSQLSVLNVWPGITGEEKRSLRALNFVVSFPAQLRRRCRNAWPRVQRPWRIGSLKPAFWANSGSAWRGLRSSPPRRYRRCYNMNCFFLIDVSHLTGADLFLNNGVWSPVGYNSGFDLFWIRSRTAKATGTQLEDTELLDSQFVIGEIIVGRD